MTRYVPRVLIGVIGFMVVALLLAQAPAGAGNAPMEEALADKTLGREDAPVVITEYSSLGCGHCAQFHAETLPRIRANYIDTGKARLIFRDYPLGAPALAAAMLARCGGADKYFGFVEIFFRGQSTWVDAKDPLEGLLKTVRFAGMSREDFDACLANEELLKAIQAKADAARDKQDVEATPTFFINGEKISGAQPYETFAAAIDAALAKAQ